MFSHSLAAVSADGSQTAGRKLYVGEGKDVAIFWACVHAVRPAVDEQLDRLRVRDYIDGLDGPLYIAADRIAPVAKDMQVRLLVLHHALGEVDLLGDPDRIDFAADAGDFARILSSV